MKSTPLQVPEI